MDSSALQTTLATWYKLLQYAACRSHSIDSEIIYIGASFTKVRDWEHVWFLYSNTVFCCLNPENGGPRLKIFCLVYVLSFYIQIFLLYNWYSIRSKWEQLLAVFTWIQLEFGYCSKNRWQFYNILHNLTDGITPQIFKYIISSIQLVKFQHIVKM